MTPTHRWGRSLLSALFAATLALVFVGCGDDAPPGPPTGCSATTCPTGCCQADGTCVTSNPAGACGIYGAACTAWKQCTGAQSCDPASRTCVGNTESCGPANCVGCCQGNTCVGGNSPTTCGAGGGSCAQCAGTQSCINGTCADDCGPSTCASGCCKSNVCFSGSNTASCGSGGGNCKECNNGEVCLSGQCTTQACDPNTCPLGCCDATGNCIAGDTESGCGKAGIACKECGSGEICDKDRVCKTPPTTCTAATCADGCCDTTGTCIKLTSQSGQACGTGGGACSACAATQECSSGKCTCTTSSCASGCCEGDTCRDGATNTACGKAGAKCDTCAGSESCQAGVCASTYDCAKQCTGCCDGNTCIANGPTSDTQCGKGGVACSDCTTSAKTCQSGLCLSTGICGACGPGTCCTTTGCTAGDQNTTCGDTGAPCDDCTKSALPMICNATTRKCEIDPNSTWKLIIDAVTLKTTWNFEGNLSDAKPWDKPDAYVEVWHSVATKGTSTWGSNYAKTAVINDNYTPLFNSVVLTKIKASALLPDSSGKANFALSVWENDFWADDKIAECRAITVSQAAFNGSLRAIYDCSVTGSTWYSHMIEKVTFRILPD